MTGKKSVVLIDRESAVGASRYNLRNIAPPRAAERTVKVLY